MYMYTCMGICICELGHGIKYIYGGSQPNKIWNPLAPRMERELEKYNEEERQVLERKVQRQTECIDNFIQEDLTCLYIYGEYNVLFRSYFN